MLINLDKSFFFSTPFSVYVSMLFKDVQFSKALSPILVTVSLKITVSRLLALTNKLSGTLTTSSPKTILDNVEPPKKLYTPAYVSLSVEQFTALKYTVFNDTQSINALFPKFTIPFGIVTFLTFCPLNEYQPMHLTFIPFSFSGIV